MYTSRVSVHTTVERSQSAQFRQFRVQLTDHREESIADYIYRQRSTELYNVHVCIWMTIHVQYIYTMPHNAMSHSVIQCHAAQTAKA